MKKILILILIMLTAVCNGCLGGEESTFGPRNTSNEMFLEISGTLSMSGSPALISSGAVARSFEFNGGKHSIAIVDKNAHKTEIGTVTMNGNYFKARVPIISSSRYPMIIVYEKSSGRILFRKLFGRMINIGEMPYDAFIVKVNGPGIDAYSTALALFALEKGVPDIPLATLSPSEAISGVIYREFGSAATPFDEAIENLAGGKNNVIQASSAVSAVTAVLNSFEIEDNVKNLVSARPISNVSEMLIAYVNALNTPAALSFIVKSSLPTNITIGNNEISGITGTGGIQGIISGIAPGNRYNAPVFSPPEGRYSLPISITITSAAENAAIKYTLDGSPPSPSNGIDYTGPVPIVASMTIKAVAVKTGTSVSDISTASYVISDTTTAAPVFSLAEGTYNDDRELVITTSTQGASIHYTDDGATPSESSKLYTGKLTISSTVTIRAIAIKNGLAPSTIVSRTYTIDKDAPVFTIQYYSDKAMSNPINGIPRLKTGTYYMKISSSRPLFSSPEASIFSEGDINDITAEAAVPLAGNEFTLTREIKYDAKAAGNSREEIFISAIDSQGRHFSNMRPVNESTRAAYTDTIRPAAGMSLSVTQPLKQGSTVTIYAEVGEDISSVSDLKLSLNGADSISGVTMTRNDSRRFSYSYTAGTAGGTVFVTLKGAFDLAGNEIEENPTGGASFTISDAPPDTADTTAPTTAIPADLLTFSNATGKTGLKSEFTPNEKAKFEIYFGAATPVATTPPAGASAIAAVHHQGDLITGLGVQTPGYKIFYRLVDSSGNASKWTQDGTIPAATGLDVSKIAACAAGNRILIDESHSNMRIAAYIDDTHRQTIEHSNATPDSIPVAGAALATGNTLKYAIEGDDGNHSIAVADGTVPSPAGLDASKLSASAALNKLSVAAAHPAQKIAVFINGEYRQTISHVLSVANSVAVTGSTLAEGDSLKYAVENTNGNKSTAISDGTIPTISILDVSMIRASIALNSIQVDSALQTLKFAVFVNGIYRQSISHVVNTADEVPLEGAALVAGNALKYAVEDDRGNQSPLVSDGSAPAVTGLDISKIYASAATGALVVDAAHPTARIAMFVNDRRRATVIHVNALADNVPLGEPPLAAGDSLKYAIEDDRGNHSAFVSDGTVPSSAGLDVSKIYASAGHNRVNVDDDHPSTRIAIFINGTYRQSVAHALSTANAVQIIGTPLTAGDNLKYAIEDTNGNHSATILDGNIPNATNLDATKTRASAAQNAIIVESSHPTTKMAVYITDIFRQTIAHTNAAETSVPVSGVPLAAGNTLKYAIENENGNHSTFVSDGAVPVSTGLDISRIRANAAKNTIDVDEIHPTFKIAVFVNGAYRQTIDHINAAPDSVPMTGAALTTGNAVKYSIEDEYGNASPAISDGTIPSNINLDVSKIYASAALNSFNIEAGHATTRVAIFVNGNYRQTIAHSVSTANSATAVGTALMVGDALKYAVEDASGNLSAMIPDGVIPSSAAVDISKTGACATRNMIIIDESHPTAKIAVHVSDIYRQTISHISSVPNAEPVAGAPLAAGATLKYAIESDEGNHSPMVADGAIPATTGLDTTKIFASAASNTISIDESHPSFKIAIFVNDSYRQTVAHANALADSLTPNGPPLITGDALKYALEDSSGNHSAGIADGAIPSAASIAVSKLYASEAFNRIYVDASHTNLKIAVYANNEYRQTISHTLGTANAVNVIGSALAGGDSLKYCAEDANGNHSAPIADGAIPSADGIEPTKIHANAATGTVVVDAAHSTGKIAVFVNDVYRQTVDHSGGTLDDILVAGAALAAGNTLKYAVEDGGGNHSSLVADGAIPAAPSALAIPAVTGKSNANYISAASAASQSVNVSFTAVPSAGTIDLIARDSGGATATASGNVSTSGLTTFLTGLDLGALATDGTVERLSATLSNAASGNVSTQFSQITTGMVIDRTPPSFTARLYASDGSTRIPDLTPASPTDRIVLAFSETLLASSVNTTANTGINTDISIFSDDRATQVTGASTAGSATFTNAVSVSGGNVTIVMNTIPSTANNVIRNSPAGATSSDAHTVISCNANQITDVAGNPASVIVVPLK